MAIALSSCIEQEKDQENRSTTIVPLPLPLPTETILPTTMPTGITYEEQIRNIPPSPRNLTGVFKDNYIELRWDIPEKVELPHNYKNTIIRYNIYKGTDEENIIYLTYVTERKFLDFNVSYSQQYIYEITAVHEGDVEGLPSENVIVVR